MTAKQFLDAFSETLMQDERILSPRERGLLMSILQNSRQASNDPQTQSAVTAVMARSVGETVAQRAFSLLGGSIVDQILARSGISAGTEESLFAATVRAGSSPNVVPPAPQPPNVPKDVPDDPPAPQPPNISLRSSPIPPEPPSELRSRLGDDPPAPQPPHAPQPPGAPAPQPPHSPQPPQSSIRHGARPISVQQAAQQNQDASRGGVGVLEEPEIKRAQCVVLDEFLAPQELDDLVRYALKEESEFQNSEVVSPNGEAGMINYSHRRSRVLLELGKHQDVMLERVRRVLPGVLDRFGLEEFPITRVEAQITASNDGDFFRAHSDDAHETVASRHITFVYFFHRDPCQFEGGELLLHDARGSSKAGSYQKIVPQQNQIVFFPCSVLHEINPIQCASRAFADSRFTLNGWLHK